MAAWKRTRPCSPPRGRARVVSAGPGPGAQAKPAPRVVAGTSDVEATDAVYADCRDDVELDGVRSVLEEDTWSPELPKNVADVVNALADLVEASLKTEGDRREP